MPSTASDTFGAGRLLPELGCYALAGQPRTPRAILEETVAAEKMGLGTAFISERWNVKEAATLSGAAAAVTTRIGIATAATNHTTRHPLITGSYAATMHLLSEGRFRLGLGRGVAGLHAAAGLPAITTAQLEDFASLMRRLWRGETIVDHHGPAGRYPWLQLDSSFDLSIPLGVVAFGPQTLRLAGRAFDEVVLHTFFTDETLQRSIATVKRAAEEAGRDPAAVRVWSCFATVGEHLSADDQRLKLTGRLAAYLQMYGALMVRANNWDPVVLERFLADPIVQSYGREALDGKATSEELERIETLLPVEWLAAAATGTAKQCAEAVLRQIDLGADGVILHGATPSELAPIVSAYRGCQTEKEQA